LAARHVKPGSLILDAGCRDAADLVRLVQTHKGRGIGVDPVAIHVERARAAVTDAGLADRIEIVQGVIEELPYPERSVDFVWCRDVLAQVEPLRAALSCLSRILRPDGRAIIYTTFVTELLTAQERALLERHLGNVAANLDEHGVEEAFDQAGLRIELKDIIGSEVKEHAEEHSQSVSKTLLRLARLHRLRDAVTNTHGEEIYNHIDADLHWELYQCLGKLQPTVYLLRHR
jgi:ubiquinone/menaquinone biosynthesis C-methylase UbiE